MNDRPDAPPDRHARAFVDTYDSRSYADPWEAIVDYRRVRAYHGRHPEHGRHRVGRALDLPANRVRGWLEGGKPDVLHGYETATEQGWLPFDPDTLTGRGLTALLAWTYAGGSVGREYNPRFAVGNIEEWDTLERVADVAGVDLAVSRAGERGRANEYRPAEHACVLGRVLAALGAPVGGKNPDTSVVLPPYLSEASTPTRRTFVATYLLLRAHPQDTGVMTLREERSERYLRSLARLFESVLGSPVTVSDLNLILSTDAAERYRSWPGVLADITA
jgi:hypothetical protein